MLEVLMREDREYSILVGTGDVLTYFPPHVMVVNRWSENGASSLTSDRQAVQRGRFSKEFPHRLGREDL